MKYKLIQTYPGYETLGITHCSENKTPEWRGTNFYDAHPKYWQKVEEVDYEVLSYRDYNGKIFEYSQNGYAINSVKRLSDGEVFTIGDEYFNNEAGIYTEELIHRINIVDNECRIYNNECCGYYLLEQITKLPKKTPLFTTEDGKEIFEGDKYYVVYADFSLFGYNAIENKIAAGNKFSSCKKAEKFKLLNYPVLCLNDLLSVWGNAEYPEKSPLFKKFEELAKSKL